MSAIAHYNSLIAKHFQLEEEIHAAYTKHLPDNIITSLKKQKLHVKEELLELEKKYNLQDIETAAAA